MRPDVSVVVPVFNNSATLDELLDRLIAVLAARPGTFEIVLVDDGSKDDSLAKIERRAALDPRVQPYALVRNFGSQSASCAGFDLARGRRVVHIDADLELFPEDIPPMLDAMDQGADLVCAYRVDRQSPRFTRRLPSWLVNAYVRRRTGFSLRDVGCGLRAADAAIVRNLVSEGEARRFLSPLLLQRAKHIVETPARHRPTSTGRGQSLYTLADIALDYFLITARRPFLVSGLVAAAACALGVCLLIIGPRAPGLLLAVAGALGLQGALLGSYVHRIYQLQQGVPFYQLRDDVPQLGRPARNDNAVA